MSNKSKTFVRLVFLTLRKNSNICFRHVRNVGKLNKKLISDLHSNPKWFERGHPRTPGPARRAPTWQQKTNANTFLIFFLSSVSFFSQGRKYRSCLRFSLRQNLKPIRLRRCVGENTVAEVLVHLANDLNQHMLLAGLSNRSLAPLFSKRNAPQEVRKRHATRRVSMSK